MLFCVVLFRIVVVLSSKLVVSSAFQAVSKKGAKEKGRVRLFCVYSARAPSRGPGSAP
jgi:hypothetical protein